LSAITSSIGPSGVHMLKKDGAMTRKCFFALLGSLTALSTTTFPFAEQPVAIMAVEVNQSPPTSAAPVIAGANAFIRQHCADCHDSTTKEAGLDLTAQAFDPDDKANFALWVRVH